MPSARSASRGWSSQDLVETLSKRVVFHDWADIISRVPVIYARPRERPRGGANGAGRADRLARAPGARSNRLLDRGESAPAVPAGEPATVSRRRRSPTASGTGVPGGPYGATRDRYDRDSGHVVALASAPHCTEVDVRSATQPAQRPSRNSTAGRAHGGGESDVGLHADPRRTKDVGHRVGRSTIRRILKTAGLPPVPQRPTSWTTFLKAHWGVIAGADFFTTEVWTWRGLVTYYTVFVIDLASRRVRIGSSTSRRGVHAASRAHADRRG